LTVCYLTFLLTSAITLTSFICTAQTDTRRKKFDKAIFKDTLDGKLDAGRFLIQANGFIPIPQIITEPALGHFGLMLAPVFIKPNKVRVEGKYVPPDITAAFVGYTLNNTWMLGGVRKASLPKHHLKYRAGGAYGSVNMDYYRTLPQVGEKKFAFNFKMATILGSMLRQIGESDWYVGMDYLFMHNEVTPDFGFDELPDFLNNADLDANISSIGVDVEMDKRDNVFTPDAGWYFATDFGVNASWTGSDYDFQLLNVSLFRYFQFTDKWVSGFRLESSLQWGDAPFYSKPSIALRGVPMARYQGDRTFVFETEQRYDFSLRWSAIVFGGLAKAPT